MKHSAYPKYKKSGVEWLGDMPEHWNIKRLKYCFSLNTKKAITDENPIALENIESWTGRLIETGSEFEGDGISFNDGDILFGKLRPYLAKVYLAEKAGESIGDIFVLRPTSQIISKYAAQCLRTNNYIEIIDGSTYGSKMPRAGWEFMGSLPFLIPPLPEQQAIAAFLDCETGRIDSLIGKKQKLIELLKEKRTALISRAVTKGLNPKTKMKPSGVEWLGDVPEHWGVKKLKYLFKNLDYRRIPVAAEDRSEIEKIYPYYGASGIIDYVDNYLFDEELILVAEDGANLYSRSTPLAFIAKGKYWVNNHAHILRPIMNNPKYWECLLQIFDFTPLVTGSAQPKLTAENLGSILLPVPTFKEQQAIADFLDRETAKIDTLIMKVEAVVEKLKEYRTALISATVTGKIDVREVA